MLNLKKTSKIKKIFVQKIRTFGIFLTPESAIELFVSCVVQRIKLACGRNPQQGQLKLQDQVH